MVCVCRLHVLCVCVCTAQCPLVHTRFKSYQHTHSTSPINQIPGPFQDARHTPTQVLSFTPTPTLTHILTHTAWLFLTNQQCPVRASSGSLPWLPDTASTRLIAPAYCTGTLVLSGLFRYINTAFCVCMHVLCVSVCLPIQQNNGQVMSFLVHSAAAAKLG